VTTTEMGIHTGILITFVYLSVKLKATKYFTHLVYVVKIDYYSEAIALFFVCQNYCFVRSHCDVCHT